MKASDEAAEGGLKLADGDRYVAVFKLLEGMGSCAGLTSFTPPCLRTSGLITECSFQETSWLYGKAPIAFDTLVTRLLLNCYLEFT